MVLERHLRGGGIPARSEGPPGALDRLAGVEFMSYFSDVHSVKAPSQASLSSIVALAVAVSGCSASSGSVGSADSGGAAGFGAGGTGPGGGLPGGDPGSGGSVLVIGSTGGSSTGIDGGECGSVSIDTSVEEVVTPGNVLIIFDQ